MRRYAGRRGTPTGGGGAGARPAAPLAGLVRRYEGSRIEGAQPGSHRGCPSPYLELDISLGEPIQLAAMPDPAGSLARW
ncbi:MAG TPA: hypothetical protein VIL37_12335 [Natronosporangium sp.]